jgi:8-oxo-dGTP pyrophosphatase MutT (NUDIX family)
MMFFTLKQYKKKYDLTHKRGILPIIKKMYSFNALQNEDDEGNERDATTVASQTAGTENASHNSESRTSFHNNYNMYSKRNMFCNNCGKNGHVMHACKNPIISNGIIVYKDASNGDGSTAVRYLMIRRKDTLGFVEFIRGKYPVYNECYVQRLVNEMTLDEKHRLQTQTFSELWKNVWGDYLNSKYQNEEAVSCDRFNMLKSGIKLVRNGGSYYTLDSLIKNSNTKWTEPEWGFPKGRRNYQEKDIDCAMREFSEETGYDANRLTIMQNVIPYEEIFMGSNMKTYKHKYYIACMKCHDKLPSEFQKTEVSKMGWFTYDECIERIRPYNLEKINILRKLNDALVECKRIDH